MIYIKMCTYCKEKFIYEKEERLSQEYVTKMFRNINSKLTIEELGCIDD